MERIKFLKVLGALPLISIPLRLFGKVRTSQPVCRTQRDAEGPFYKTGAPVRSVIETHGVCLQIQGTIFKRDCKTPIADGILDVWHCDKEGHYDMKGFNGRAQVKADAAGRYSFTTILPPPYGNRPRHIHVKVRARGHEELTTQLYFKGDPNINNDFARNAEPARVIELKTAADLKTGIFDIYL